MGISQDCQCSSTGSFQFFSWKVFGLVRSAEFMSGGVILDSTGFLVQFFVQFQGLWRHSILGQVRKGRGCGYWGACLTCTGTRLRTAQPIKQEVQHVLYQRLRIAVEHLEHCLLQLSRKELSELFALVPRYCDSHVLISFRKREGSGSTNPILID